MGTIKLRSKYQYVNVMKKNAYITRAVHYSTIPSDEVVRMMAVHSLVPESQSEAALEAIFDAFDTFLMNGHGVKLPYIGTFRFGVRAHVTDDKKKAGAQQVYRRKILFTPTSSLKREVLATKLRTIPVKAAQSSGD